MLLQFDEHPVLDSYAERMNMIGALVLRLIHQLVSTLEKLLRELPRNRTTFGDVAQHHADDADVDADRLLGQPRVLAGPVMTFDSFAESFGDDPRGAALVDIRNEEAEFVAAQSCVQVLTGARVQRLLRDQVVGAHLLAKQPGDAIDNPVTGRVAERVVVPLERVDIDETNRAPASALFEREKRLHLLDEAAEVHQPRLRIAMDAVGEVRDEVLEVAGDAAHRRVAGREFLAQPVETIGESGGYRLDGLLLRLLPEALVFHEDVVDRLDERLLVRHGQMHTLVDPLVEFRPGLRR